MRSGPSAARAKPPALLAALLCAAAGLCGLDGVAQDLPDVFSEEIARLSDLATSPAAELRLAAARGLSSLGHAACEKALVTLLGDARADVRREAAFGLGRLGGRAGVEALAARLDDLDPWVREQAAASLVRLTGLEPPAAERCSRVGWQRLLAERLAPGRSRRLAEMLQSPAERGAALREIAALGGGGLEGPLLELHASGGFEPREADDFHRALARVATPRSVPALAAAAPVRPGAAWTLGDLGGEAAERALLEGLRRRGAPDLHILVNLDRLKSRALYPFAPLLLGCFGLVSYRGEPDDLHLDPTPLQRVAARLLLRTGKVGEILELLLAKLEGKPRGVASRLPGEALAVASLLDRMDAELGPGFQRADGYSEAQPLAALPHLATDPALAPRLTALLDHPALVVRVYAGTALARLRVPGAAAAIARVLREGYPFTDPATQASGKHGPEISGSVRWKGYLAMALGLDASDEARETLESLVADPASPRDVRFGAAVGLRRIADSRSTSALLRARDGEIVRWIAKEAEAALDAIALAERLRTDKAGGARRGGAAEELR